MNWHASIAGAKKDWRVSMAVLQKKCGSGSTLREFRRLVVTIAKEDEEYNHMPDYEVRVDDTRDHLVVRSRGTVGTDRSEEVQIPALDPEVYDMARSAAPGWDVHMIEQEWRRWAMSAPRNPEMAFLGFCRKWAEQRGEP